MPCYRPIECWKTKDGGPTFRRAESWRGETMKLPCGRCIGCRIDRSRQWAVRCMHEASLHDFNSYITLTYSDEYLPQFGTLCKRDWQLFMKKLRKKVPGKIRFYQAGEYGELCDACGRPRMKCDCNEFIPSLGRPHFHAIIFGYGFPDKKLWKVLRGNPLYTSQLLEETWGMGFATIGEVTFESAAYVARYVMKKQTGDPSQRHYLYIDEHTGECFNRLPEYNTMSNREGIGKKWFDEHNADVYPHDYCTLKGKKVPAPRYYDKLLKRMDPEKLDAIKAARVEAALSRAADNTPERLAVREKVHTAKLNRLKRNLA